ncbi:MAG: protein-tyrosine phosphatase family protein [Ilumatobacteraceae bacterium]
MTTKRAPMSHPTTNPTSAQTHVPETADTGTDPVTVDLSRADTTRIAMTVDSIGHRITGLTVHGSHHLDLPLMSEILPGLWMGGCEDGVPLPWFIDHVVSMYPWERYAEHDGVGTMVDFPMYDMRGYVNDELVLRAARVVNELRAEGTVLVHCQAGLNRSGIVTATALILEGWDPAGAIAHLRQRRGEAVLCNPDFESWLLGLEPGRSVA